MASSKPIALTLAAATALGWLVASENRLGDGSTGSVAPLGPATQTQPSSVLTPCLQAKASAKANGERKGDGLEASRHRDAQSHLRVLVARNGRAVASARVYSALCDDASQTVRVLAKLCSSATSLHDRDYVRDCLRRCSRGPVTMHVSGTSGYASLPARRSSRILVAVAARSCVGVGFAPAAAKMMQVDCLALHALQLAPELAASADRLIFADTQPTRGRPSILTTSKTRPIRLPTGTWDVYAQGPHSVRCMGSVQVGPETTALRPIGPRPGRKLNVREQGVGLAKVYLCRGGQRCLLGRVRLRSVGDAVLVVMGDRAMRVGRGVYEVERFAPSISASDKIAFAAPPSASTRVVVE